MRDNPSYDPKTDTERVSSTWLAQLRREYLQFASHIERQDAVITKLREERVRFDREQKEGRDHIRMQADTIERLTQELADERQAVSILLRRIDSERPYPE